MNIRVLNSLEDLRSQVAPLYHRVPGQKVPAEAFLELRCASRALLVDWLADASIAPLYIKPGTVARFNPKGDPSTHVLRFPLPAAMRGKDLADPRTGFLVKPSVLMHAERVFDGYRCEHEHYAMVARFTERAWDSVIWLSQECDFIRHHAAAPVWDVNIWIDSSTRYFSSNGQQSIQQAPDCVRLEVFGMSISARTKDSELADYARRIDGLANSDGVFLDGDIADYLIELRDDLRNRAEVSHG
jgi:hypothetical protein